MLMKPDRSSLLLIDLQEKLVPAIAGAGRIVANAKTLMQAAGRLGIPLSVTEHCADRIGPIVPELRSLAPEEAIIGKRYFSGVVEGPLGDRLAALGRPKVIVGGTETHVCVLQTTLDLKAAGYAPCLVADATGTRHDIDRDVAVARMRDAGVTIVTTEMVLFEWLERGDSEDFAALLPLIKATNR